MTPAEQAERLMDRYGRVVILYTTALPTSCFLQPMRYKNKMFLDSAYTKVGVMDESCFLYLGPADQPLTEGVAPVLCDENGNEYICIKTETIWYRHQPLYQWAILRLGVRDT